MNFILGAALIVAAIALLHVGSLAVRRVAATAPRRENLTADIVAIGFTALFGPGLILFFRGLINGVDAVQLAALAASVAAVFLGARLIARVAERSAATVPAGGAPQA